MKKPEIIVKQITNHNDIEQSAAREILVESFIGEYSQYLQPDDVDSKLTSWRDGPLSVQKFYENYFSSELTEFMERRLQYWVEARMDTKLVGWATFEMEKSDEPEVYMNLLVVHPNYQKQGVGKKLVMSLIDLDLIPSLSAIHLLLRKKNKGGGLFYQSLGFKLDPDYSRPDNFVDIKLLEPLTWKNPTLEETIHFSSPSF